MKIFKQPKLFFTLLVTTLRALLNECNYDAERVNRIAADLGCDATLRAVMIAMDGHLLDTARLTCANHLLGRAEAALYGRDCLELGKAIRSHLNNEAARLHPANELLGRAHTSLYGRDCPELVNAIRSHLNNEAKHDDAN